MSPHEQPPGRPGRHDRQRRAWSEVGNPGWYESDPRQGYGERPGRYDDYDVPRSGPYRSNSPQQGYGHGGQPSARGHGRDRGDLPLGARRDPQRAQRRPASYPSYQKSGGRRRASAAVIIGRLVSAIVSLALIAGSGLAWAAVGGTPHNASNATDEAGNVGVVTQMTDANGNVVPVKPGKATNILIVGSDSRTDASGHRLPPAEMKAIRTQWDGGSTATDTIMILHVPANGDAATAISIPRDTWITDAMTHAPGMDGPYDDGTTGPYKANKVNSFYASAQAYERQYLVSQGVSDEAELNRRSAEAGRTMLIKVLQQLTGVKIDHYAEVNLIGFYLLSKAIGGVPVCLLHATKDRQSGADFPAGHFTVQGSDALSFVRQRHGLPHGDLDRIRRQQEFLASAAHKMLSVGTLTSPRKLSGLIDAAHKSLVLDKNFNLLSFAQQMVGLTSGNINFTTIPTHGFEQNVGTSALHVDPAEVRALFARLMTENTSGSRSDTTTSATPTSVDPASVTVDVQNGTETSRMAAMVGQKVADAGFERGQITDYPGVTPSTQQRTTTVRYSTGGKAAAEKVRKAIGLGDVTPDNDVASGHILVVVGTDMPPPGHGLHADRNALLHMTAGAAAGPPNGGSSAGSSTTLPSDAINAADPGCIN